MNKTLKIFSDTNKLANRILKREKSVWNWIYLQFQIEIVWLTIGTMSLCSWTEHLASVKTFTYFIYTSLAKQKVLNFCSFRFNLLMNQTTFRSKQ